MSTRNLYAIALTLIPKIGSITAKKLIETLGSPEAVLKGKPALLKTIPGIGEYLAAKLSERNYLSEAEKELISIEQRKIDLCYYQDENYPSRLKECEDGPIVLFRKGNSSLESAKILSVVGTRNATEAGKAICMKIIRELAKKHPDLIIVSGLAYGIDITAHRAALENGLETISVLAHGLNTIYPPQHTQTAVKIMKQGALISDFQSTARPERANFLRRNRIIAGISDATLVIESARKGGSLITAELAESYNREVMAIPGRVNDPYSIGCNYIIQKNIAGLIDSSEAIENSMNWTSHHATQQALFSIPPLTNDERLVYQILKEAPGMGQEILSIRSGLPIPKLLVLLMQLEIKEAIRVHPGNLYHPA